MPSPLVTFAVFLIALNGMIFVHEFGHFLAARFFNIEVEEFGFGLPSYRLVTLFRWRGTDFTIHALPLGGFVRPKGENDPRVPGGLAAASPWKRLVVLFAGPGMNLLTAIVVFAALIGMQGIAVPGPIRIDDVLANSPAEQAGLMRGDLILAINGEPIQDVLQAITIVRAHLDEPVQLEVQRGSEQLAVQVTPLSSRSDQEGALGVGLTSQTRPATVAEMASGGAVVTGLQAAAIVYLPVALVQGIVAPELPRPVGLKGIFDLFDVAVRQDLQSRQATAGGASAPRPSNWTLNLIGGLSVSLGVINLLPIPALDGGRILFTLPEIALRRRIPPEMENIINGAALILLIVLMLLVNVMDFINPIEIPIP